MHTQVRKKQKKHSKTALLAGKKWWWWFWRSVVPIKIYFALVFLRSIVICFMSFPKTICSKLEFKNQSIGCCGWLGKGGFSTESFWSQKKSSQTTKKREGKVPGNRGLASEGDVFVEFVQESSTKILPNAGSPCPTLYPTLCDVPAWPQGNGLGSISCGDYDFQEGVLSSRCFGWTPGPFHQRRKNRTDSGRVLIFRGWHGMWRKKWCKSSKVGWSLIVSELNFLGDGQLNLWWELVWVKGNKTWGGPW